MTTSPICFACHRTPDELGEYVEAAEECGMTPDAYVRAEEGTFNPATGHFACTPCYVGIGCPTTPEGWIAP